MLYPCETHWQLSQLEDYLKDVPRRPWRPEDTITQTAYAQLKLVRYFGRYCNQHIDYYTARTTLEVDVVRREISQG